MPADPNPHDSAEEERLWPESMLGPPPWRVYDEDWDADAMDVAVGKLVRALPLFEAALMLTRAAIAPNRSFVGVHHDGPEQAIKAIESALPRFNGTDRFWLEVAIRQSRLVVDLRNAVVHGTWESTSTPEVFRSERPLRRSDARRLGMSDLPDEAYPTRRREFNAAGVMGGYARARWVSRYLVRNLDRWEADLPGEVT